MRKILITIFLIHAAFCKSQITKTSDSILANLSEQLNYNWRIEIISDTLKFESREPMFIEFYNSAGAPLDDPAYKKFTDEYLKEHGNKTKAILLFKMENKWTSEKIKEATDANAIIYKEVEGLLSKYKLEKIKHSYRYDEELFWGATKEEKVRIEEYKKEKEELYNKIIELPRYNSEKYSLFIISRTWVFEENKAYYMLPMIYPPSVIENINELEKLIGNILENKN